MIFDICLYLLATVTVLATAGGHRIPAEPQKRKLDAVLETIHSVGSALPDTDQCFDNKTQPEPAVQPVSISDVVVPFQCPVKPVTDHLET